MNNKSKIILIAGLASVGLVSVTLGVAATADIKPVDIVRRHNATMPTNTRRIWLVNNHGDNSDLSWWTNANLVVHVWNASGTIDVKGATVVLGSDYYKGGLVYVDITLTNATGELHAIVGQDLNGNGEISWGDNNQTQQVDLQAFGTSADVIWLQNTRYQDSYQNNRWTRNANAAAAGMSDTQLAAVLAKYNTCDVQNTYGYNGYPQLKKDFFDACDAAVLASTTTLADYDYEEYKAAGKDYSKIEKNHTSTVVDKIAGLKLMYESNN